MTCALLAPQTKQPRSSDEMPLLASPAAAPSRARPPWTFDEHLREELRTLGVIIHPPNVWGDSGPTAHRWDHREFVLL